VPSLPLVCWNSHGNELCPLLADLFIRGGIYPKASTWMRSKKKIICIRHFDISINDNKFHSYVNLTYPNELEIKDTTECSISSLYLDVLLKLDANGKLEWLNFMAYGVISISPSSAFLTYVAIFHLYLHMLFIYRSWPFTWYGNRAHSGNDLSTVNAYSS
jgi:hypothetical protein